MLRLRFEPSEDGTGQLFATVTAHGFSGQGSAWFDTQTLHSFAQSLDVFPVSRDNPPHIAGGFWSQQIHNHLEQVHLSITIAPRDSIGHLSVRVFVATPLEWNDPPESQLSATVEFSTTYAVLQQFTHHLHKLLDGDLQEAILPEAHV